MFIELRGVDKNTGLDLSGYHCAFTAQILLQLEGNQLLRNIQYEQGAHRDTNAKIALAMSTAAARVADVVATAAAVQALPPPNEVKRLEG